MALSNPPGVDYVSGANSATRVYGPVSFGASVLSFIAHFQRAASNNTTPAKGSIADTAGFAWAEVGDVSVAGTTGIPGHRITLWAARVAADVSNTITVTRGTSAGFHGLYASAFVGASNDVSNVATDSDTAGAISISLPRNPATTSAVIGFYSDHLATATAPPAGFTELREDLLTGAAGAIQYCHENGSPPQSLGWSETGRAVAIALEVREPAVYTLAVATGALSLSGQSVGLSRHTGVAIVPGSYVRTNGSVDLRAGFGLAIVPGSYGVTGINVRVGRATLLAVAGGVYSLAGEAVGFRANFRLGPEAVSFAIDGTAIGLGHARSITVAIGTYELIHGPIGLSRIRGPQVTPDIRIVLARDEERAATVPHQNRAIRPPAIGRMGHLSA